MSHIQRPADPRRSPGGQNGSVNGGHLLCPEHIEHERRHSGKTAPEAEEDVANQRPKYPGIPFGHQNTENDHLAGEQNPENPDAPDTVRQEPPEQPPDPVAQRTDGDQGRSVFDQDCRLQGRVGKAPHLLQEFRLKADDGDAGGDIEEKDHPHEDERRRPEVGSGRVGFVAALTVGHRGHRGRGVAQGKAGRQ